MADHTASSHWPMELARAAILIAVLLDVVLLSVPAAIYFGPDGAGSGAAPGWPSGLMMSVYSFQGLSGQIAAALLPLAVVSVLPAPPRWLRRAAVGGAALMGLALLVVGLINTPMIGGVLGDALFTPAGLVVISALLVPFVLINWIGALSLIFLLSYLSGSRGLGLLAGLASVAVLVLGQMQAPYGPEAHVKGLILIIAILWAWLTFARPGTLPHAAQPALVALLLIWLLPEVLMIAPAVIDALQFQSVTARWRGVVEAFAAAPIGVSLGQYPQTLLILLVVLHLGRRQTAPARARWTPALIIAAGLILPVIAWAYGLPAVPAQAIEAARIGAIGTLGAAFGVVAGVMQWAAVAMMVLVAVWLVRQPLRPALAVALGRPA